MSCPLAPITPDIRTLAVVRCPGIIGIERPQRQLGTKGVSVFFFAKYVMTVFSSHLISEGTEVILLICYSVVVRRKTPLQI